tara:strand:- start:4466 stop:5239 length:774 start_codon:yes stop_codon:yes gene_type:complete
MDIFFLLGVTAIAVVVYVTFWFLLSLLLKRNDLADIAWGPGIFLVGLVGFFFSEEGISLLLTILMGIWAFRLALRIALRNLKKKEDRRYKELAASWGKWFLLRSYLQVFLLQGMLMIFVGYPALHVAAFGSEMSVLVYLGLAVWLIGFFFEAVGDYQLDQFLGNPENKGKIMRYGLWKYTRHPNYFGEVTQWWGIFLMIILAPWGIAAIVSPLMITYLILFVSGIPMLERAFLGNTEFEEYKKRTSAFFPWFVKGDS